MTSSAATTTTPASPKTSSSNKNNEEDPLTPRAIAAAAEREAQKLHDKKQRRSAAVTQIMMNHQQSHNNMATSHDLDKLSSIVDDGSNNNGYKVLADSLQRLFHIQQQTSDDSSSSSSSDYHMNGNNDNNMDELRTTTQRVIFFLTNELQNLINLGLEAFRDLETKQRDLFLLQEANEVKERDVVRLKADEAASRQTVSKLYSAIESSKAANRETARMTQVEARLRQDVTDVRTERDAALYAQVESKRKIALLEEELKLIKSKLTRVTQEKVKMERDSRAAISLARSLDSHASSDVDFYKRKVAELNDRLQAKQTLISEQQQQLNDLRRQVERSLAVNHHFHTPGSSRSALKRQSTSSGSEIALSHSKSKRVSK